MNTVLIVFFVIVVASFVTGICLTAWENKYDVKLVFSKEKAVINKVVTNSIVISDSSIEVLEMDAESSLNDLIDLEII